MNSFQRKSLYAALAGVGALGVTGAADAVNVNPGAGVPFDCAGVTDSGALGDSRSATGGLFGGMSLINVGAGTDYTEDAVALERFNRNKNYQPAGSVSPQLQDVS